jgi:putative membrane protein
MGQWAGDSHEAMNQMMVQMMGKQGEEQMHIALGKRQGGCDLNAQFPTGGVGFMPMVGMMQNFGGGWSSFIISLVFTILLWLLVIGGIIMLVRWLVMSGKGGMMKERDNLAMRILKERYVKGEISREDFEKMKNDLS